jgi:hypothetical protein
MSDRAMTFTVGKDLFTDAPCDACNEPLRSGERVFHLTHCASPWKAEDDEDQDYRGYTWHKACDEGSLAADGAP